MVERDKIRCFVFSIEPSKDEKKVRSKKRSFVEVNTVEADNQVVEVSIESVHSETRRKEPEKKVKKIPDVSLDFEGKRKLEEAEAASCLSALKDLARPVSSPFLVRCTISSIPEYNPAAPGNFQPQMFTESVLTKL